MITKQQIIENLKRDYGLEIVKIEMIERLMFRQSFMLSDIDKNRYILKDYSDKFNLQELNRIWQYYWTLRKMNLKVGCPLGKKFSDEFHMHLNHRYYVVFEYVFGEHPSVEQYEEIAKCLKKYHEVANPNLLTSCSSTGTMLREAKQQFKFFFNGDYSIKQEILSCRDQYMKIIDNYTESIDTIIHGDSILENIVSNDGKSYLIDFDNLRFGNAMEDVANTVLSLIYYGTDRYNINPQRIKQVRLFLHSYYCDKLPIEVERIIFYYMQVHCVIELSKHAENIRLLVRMPGMKEYLILLIKVICSSSFTELIRKEQ